MGVPPQMLEVKGSHKKLQIARSPSSSHPQKKHQQDFNSVLKLIAFLQHSIVAPENLLASFHWS